MRVLLLITLWRVVSPNDLGRHFKQSSMDDLITMLVTAVMVGLQGHYGKK